MVGSTYRMDHEMGQYGILDRKAVIHSSDLDSFEVDDGYTMMTIRGVMISTTLPSMEWMIDTEASRMLDV